MDQYTIGMVVATVLRERRAEAARAREWRAAQPSGTSLRRRVGTWLVALGDRIGGPQAGREAREGRPATLA